MKSILQFIIFSGLSAAAMADTILPIPGPEAIRLRFDKDITAELKDVISNDFNRCFAPYANSLELFSSSDNPTNNRFWLEYFTPYGRFAAIAGLGPRFPEYGVYSNDTFTIDVSYSFATNYQRHIASIAAYSNEIASAYSFIESLSPENLQRMSANELLSLDLWKEVPPGQFPSTEEDVDDAMTYCRNRYILPPPRVSFHVWECGPTNNPPYLWCTVPRTNETGRTYASLMIFFQNRWWFSTWPFVEGEQQW